MASNSSSTLFSAAWDATIIPRANFYIVTPSESMFAHVRDVPDYVTQSLPFWFVLMFLEYVTAHLLGKRTARLNDTFSSLAAGSIQQISKVLLFGFELKVYSHIYENYRVVDLSWDSLWLWWLCVFAYDLGYYWAHRAGHEINFLWAAHQVHHSSECYNLSTALRQSMLQGVFFWVFYTPLALLIPPSVFKAHAQFNLIYQFWIHTELVDSLGPLEWVMNTPSHHRVHHGRNPYCLDKNYAAVFIIWDRMFGTFAAERRDKPIAYGLVYPVDFWNPIKAQLFYYQAIFANAWNRQGILVKLQSLVRGPGWAPATEAAEDLPEVQYPVKPFNRNLPLLFVPYILVHFVALQGLYRRLMSDQSMETLPRWLGASYAIYSLSAVGMLFDHKWYAPVCEILRLLLVLVGSAPAVVAVTGMPSNLFFPAEFQLAGQAVFTVSLLFWSSILARQFHGSGPFWQTAESKKIQ